MEPNQSGQLGTMINTQPSQQALPDPNVASLVPQQSQAQQASSPQMDVNTAKSAMGNATYLASFLLPKKKGDTPQQPGNSDASIGQQKPSEAPESPKEDKDESGIEARLTKQIDELKDQITNTHQLDEISRIRQELTDLLKEDGGQK